MTEETEEPASTYLPMDLVAIVLRAAYDDMNIDTRRALRIRPRRFGPSGPCMLSVLWAQRSESWSLRKLDNGAGSPLASVRSGFLEDGSKVQDLSVRCVMRISLAVYDDINNIGDVVMRFEKIKNDVAYTFTQCNVNTGAVMQESIFGDDLDDEDV